MFINVYFVYTSNTPVTQRLASWFGKAFQKVKTQGYTYFFPQL